MRSATFGAIPSEGEVPPRGAKGLGDAAYRCHRTWPPAGPEPERGLHEVKSHKMDARQ